ncbi:hypothetical protein OJ997_25615 [Solirubrobacter phytolaccae]|uniref:Uncharacterized protein n=1 Tax=Solirubrobacter phytolaccae TaxID=1404360 RepID=A0A9X3NC44_9ACTN|nr:hypothetical protein [Solirubrobacter phytolaccae]MDA0183713.1 hypothetical protein [Solirubrobacter phytolaccae]
MLTTLALVSALAAPTPLTTMTVDDPLYGGGDAYALSGDTAFFTRTRGRELRVYALPITGGTPRQVFSYRVPRKTTPRPELSASPQRVALSVEYETSGGEFDSRVFSGPPAGPWTRVDPIVARQSIPPTVSVDGDRLITLERVDKRDVLVVRDAAGVHQLPIPDQDSGSQSATVAGDLMAYVEEHRVVIRNWRTGADVATPTFTGFPDWVALGADGHAAVVTGPESLHDVLPGGVPRRIPGIGWQPVIAGQRVVYRDNRGLQLLEPDGTVRPFGIATRQLDSFTADERHVLWNANGCLLVAPIESPLALGPAPGPCAPAELELDEQAPQKLKSTLRVTIRCVSAPGACEGTLRLTAGFGPVVTRAQRFSIPVGEQRPVRVRVTKAGRRLLAKAIRRDRGVIVYGRATVGGRTVSTSGSGTVVR